MGRETGVGMVGHSHSEGLRQLEVVEEHERLHPLTEIAGAHQPRDRAMRMAGGAMEEPAAPGPEGGVIGRAVHGE